MNISEKPFSTLLQEAGCKDHWYPRRVESYQWAFKLDVNIPNSYALRKNLAYSMQYLEFLEKEFKELSLSSVIFTMLVKTYVITGMSVLEGLFTNIIKANGWWNKSTLESIGTVEAGERDFCGTAVVIKTELLKRVPEHLERMDLDAMIQKLSHHHEALQVDHLVYPALKRLKELRNRVHLQKTDSDTDHDYNAFSFLAKKEMGYILHTILTSKMVTDTPEFFDFLKCNVDADEAENRKEDGDGVPNQF